MYFSDFFDISPELMERENVFDISLVSDLPLFIDPFLIFECPKAEYQQLHRDIVDYVRFIQTKAIAGPIAEHNRREWLHFKEVPENWLGFSVGSNRGHGLGNKFSTGATLGLRGPVSDFGEELESKGSHVERMFLFTDGTGKDGMSDFITNLCKRFLLRFTQEFAKNNIDPALCREMHLNRVFFDYSTERWQSEKFVLPIFQTSFVLLTPLDLLTQSIPWINRPDLFDKFGGIIESIPNTQRRSQVNGFIQQRLSPPPNHPKGKGWSPTKRDIEESYVDALKTFPELANYYIRLKEETGQEAVAQGRKRVTRAADIYRARVIHFVNDCLKPTGFFSCNPKDLGTLSRLFSEALAQGGHRLFFNGAMLVEEITATDVELICTLAWRADGNSTRTLPDFKFIATPRTLVSFESKYLGGEPAKDTVAVSLTRSFAERISWIAKAKKFSKVWSASLEPFQEEFSVESIFVSYTQADIEWARWISERLLSAGYSVTVQYKDFLPGTNFVEEMDRAVRETDRTVSVLSPEYLESDFAGAEWQAAFREDPLGQNRKLVPVRVKKVNPKGLLGSVVFADLVGCGENAATAILLGALSAQRRPNAPTAGAPFPGVREGDDSMEQTVASFPKMEKDEASVVDVAFRFELAEKVSNLSTDQVNLLVFAVAPPENEIPPISASAKERANALLAWCFKSNLDLQVLQQILDHLES